MANRLSRLVVGAKASYDGRFRGRYPNGDAPQILTGAAVVASSAGATLAGSGAPLAAPADLWVHLMGQTVAQQGGATPPAAPNPNTLTIAFLEVAGATGYNVYRTVNGGTETLYGSNISPTGTGVVVVQDNAANGCINGTAGPTSGVYYKANTYRYRVSTLNGAVEGPKTAKGQKYYVFHGSRGGVNGSQVNSNGINVAAGGYKWFGDYTDSSILTTDYASTGANETGLSWLNTPTGSFPYALPVAGGIYPQWNLWVGSIGPTGALYIDILKTNATTSLGLHGEIVGDLVIQPTGTLHPNQPANLDVQAYIQNGPVSANNWFPYRIPIADFMTYNGNQQYAVYKWLMQINGGTSAAWRNDNVYYWE